MIFSKKKEIEFPKSVFVGEIEYSIKVVFILKRNSSVVVKGKTLDFRLSSRLSQKQAQSHFDDLFKKIVVKLQRSPVKNHVSFEEVYIRGYFDFGGVRFVFEQWDKSQIRLKENIFYVPLGVDLEKLQKKIILILCKEYLSKLERVVSGVNLQTFRFGYGSISLKYVTSKWGHCSHKNDLLFNLKLFNAPFEVFEYVIIHELAHIKHKNHSSKFWNEVQRFCPSYKVLRKYLKDNSPDVFQ